MSALTIANVFSPGTVALSALVDANFSTIATWANGGIDASNINTTTGATPGLYASQLLPTSAARATFGATATGVGYKFLANDTTATPLTVSGVSAQTGDIMDWNTSGGKTMFVAAGGQLAFVNTGLTTGPGASVLQISADAGATSGFQFNVPTASTNGYRFLVNASTVAAQITSLSQLVVNGGFVSSTAGQVGIALGATSAVIIFGSSSTTAGLVDFGATTGGKWSFQLDPSVPTYAPINGGAYTNASDAAFKTNIAPIQSGTSEIMALKPSSFTVKNTGAAGLGFIAQDVQAVLPDLVSADGNGMLGVCYDGIIPVLVKAFQELNSEFVAYVAAHA